MKGAGPAFLFCRTHVVEGVGEAGEGSRKHVDLIVDVFYFVFLAVEISPVIFYIDFFLWLTLGRGRRAWLT